MFHTRGLSLTLMGIAAASLASAADAAVTTSYAGTECVQEVTASPLIAYQNSRASSLSGSTAFFACPAAQHGGLVSQAQVSGRDLSATGGVSCHMETRDRFDLSGSFGATVSTSAAFVGSYTLTLPAPASFFSAGSKVVHCSIPPFSGTDGSAVGSYVVTEN